MTGVDLHADVAARIAARIRDAATGPARAHTLVVGARGSGKTHVVDSAVGGTLGGSRLRRRVAVAWIGEDTVALSSYADLLLLIQRRLGGLDPRSATLRRDRNHVGLERRIEQSLGDRVLVLVLENLHHVFGAIGRSGAGALRGWVESSGRVLVIATTPRVFRDVTARDEPWFGNFATERLRTLTDEDGRALLLAAAHARRDTRLASFVESPTGLARVRALRHLLGDSVRAWAVVADRVDVAMLDDFAGAVRVIRDSLTAYFTVRLRALPADQQALVTELALGSGAQSVGELADHTGQDAKVTGTTLRRLTDAHLVTAAKVPGTDQRTTWYHLREPLLRLHLQWEALDSAARGGVRGGAPPVPDVLCVLRETYAAHPLDPAASSLAAQVLAAMGGDISAYAHLPGDLRAIAAPQPPP